MVAYVRGGRTIAKDLAPVLASRNRHSNLGSPSVPVVASGSGSYDKGEVLQITSHQRSFVWPGHGTACEIRIFHSWHHCS